MKFLHVIRQLASKDFYITLLQKIYIFAQKHKIAVFGIVFFTVAAFFVFAPDIIWAQVGQNTKSALDGGTTGKHVAKAAVGTLVSLQQYVVQFLGYVVYYLVVVPLGWFIILLFQVLTAVASYNEFLSSAAVTKGWVIVRDIANMAVIVFLVIVAFSMIIGYETYGNFKTLKRLLLMALLINFSKTICGVFIDISQVIMLTFVNGFKFVSGVSLVQGMQLDKMMKLGEVPKDGEIPTLINALASVILAAIFMFTILVVIIVIIATLVWRIVNLWMLVILSPLAFLASAFSAGPLGSLYSQWQKKFVDFLINGPILAFFLWLALTIMNGLQQVTSNDAATAAQSGVQGLYTVANGVAGATLTEAFTGGNVSLLIISIGLLCASLVLASSFGAIGATAGLGKIKGFSKGTVKHGLKWTAKAQDAALGIGTSAMFGRTMNVSSSARLAKKYGKKAGLGLQNWYYKSGQDTARRGGVAGELKTAWQRSRAVGDFWRGTKNPFKKDFWKMNNSPQEEMQVAQGEIDRLTQEEEQIEDFSSYKQGAHNLAAARTISHLNSSGSVEDKKKANEMAKAFGYRSADNVDASVISNWEQTVNERRQKLKDKYSEDEIKQVESGELSDIVTVDKDGNSVVNRHREVGDKDWIEQIHAQSEGKYDQDALSQTRDKKNKMQGYYEKVRGRALRGLTDTEYVRNQQILAENAQKRQEQYTDKYTNLNNESEIAGYILAEKNPDAHRALLSKAMEQGMLRKVAKQVFKERGFKDENGNNVDVGFEGLRQLFGYSAEEREGGYIRPEDVELFQEIAKKGKAEGVVGFASGVATDSGTGRVYFTDLKASSDIPGKDEQFVANMERIKKRQLPPNEMFAAMVQDKGNGKFELSSYGKEAVRQFGENFLEDVRRGTGGAAFDEAVMDEFEKVVEARSSGASDAYDNQEYQRINQLKRRIDAKRTGRRIGTGNRQLYSQRNNVIRNIEQLDENLHQAQLRKDSVSESALKKVLEEMQHELQDLNLQVDLPADSQQKIDVPGRSGRSQGQRYDNDQYDEYGDINGNR